MKYDADGHILITETKDRDGLYSSQGYLQVTNATAETNFVGVYAPDGSMNYSVPASLDVLSPLYAPNGSIYMTTDTERHGIYTRNGLWNAVFGV